VRVTPKLGSWCGRPFRPIPFDRLREGVTQVRSSSVGHWPPARKALSVANHGNHAFSPESTRRVLVVTWMRSNRHRVASDPWVKFVPKAAVFLRRGKV